MVDSYRPVLRKIDLIIAAAILLAIGCQLLVLAWLPMIPSIWAICPSLLVYLVLIIWLAGTYLNVLRQVSRLTDRLARVLFVAGLLALGYFEAEWMLADTPVNLRWAKQCTLTSASLLVMGLMLVFLCMHRKSQQLVHIYEQTSGLTSLDDSDVLPMNKINSPGDELGDHDDQRTGTNGLSIL